MRDDDFRKIIAKEKERRGLTYADLEAMTGAAQQTINNYVIGARSIRIGTLVLILEGLGLELGVRRKKDVQKSIDNEVPGVRR